MLRREEGFRLAAAHWGRRQRDLGCRATRGPSSLRNKMCSSPAGHACLQTCLRLLLQGWQFIRTCSTHARQAYHSRGSVVTHRRCCWRLACIAAVVVGTATPSPLLACFLLLELLQLQPGNMRHWYNGTDIDFRDTSNDACLPSASQQQQAATYPSLTDSIPYSRAS